MFKKFMKKVKHNVAKYTESGSDRRHHSHYSGSDSGRRHKSHYSGSSSGHSKRSPYQGSGRYKRKGFGSSS